MKHILIDSLNRTIREATEEETLQYMQQHVGGMIESAGTGYEIPVLAKSDTMYVNGEGWIKEPFFRYGFWIERERYAGSAIIVGKYFENRKGYGYKDVKTTVEKIREKLRWW